MKINKIVIALLILFLLTQIMVPCAFAATISAPEIDGGSSPTIIQDNVEGFGEKIFSAIYSVGVAISVIVLAILGIKYMLGSASEKAEYKKRMMPYLIGAICLFSASTVANIIYTVIKG